MYNIAGQVLESKTARLNKGVNIVDLPAQNKQQHEIRVVSLFINNRLVFSQKAIF